MTLDLLQIEILYKLTMSTLLLSIPEELYFVLFIYIMMGEFDQWLDEDCPRLFQPWDYPRILIPAVSAAIISNILRYTGASLGVISAGTYLSLFFLIVAMGDVFNNAGALRWIIKAFIFLLLATLYSFVCELSYAFLLLYSTGKTFAELSANFFLWILLSLPLRVLQYSLVVFLIVHKRSLLRARIIQIIFASKVLTVFALLSLLANVTFLLFMGKIMFHEKALDALPADLQLLVFIGVCLFPIVNLSALVWCTYYVNNREAVRQKEAANRIKKMIAEIKTYAESGKFDNVVWTLNGLSSDLEVISNHLYQEEKYSRKKEVSSNEKTELDRKKPLPNTR